MRTWRLIGTMWLLPCLAVFWAGGLHAAEFKTKAKFAILMDSRSGKVYFAKRADDLMAPASMSKIMTMLLVFEKLKEGRLSLDDDFLISPDAWKRGGARSGGSTMYAKVNSRVKLRDLIRGVIVQSANDACIAIAEGVAGSEEAYAEDMTKRARELGLQKSTFKNATGLPAKGHVMTVRELAMLTRYLIEVFPEHYKIYSERAFTWNKIKQGNRNPLLGSYKGADGVKTGHTKESGYGLVGSAVRNGRRLIVVLSGMRSKGDRSRESQKLLDWGFRRFRPVRVFKAGQRVTSARVWGGESSWVPLMAKDDIKMLVADDERKLATSEVLYNGPVHAPVKKGQQIGEVRFKVDGRIVSRVPLYAGKSVDVTETMWRKAYDSLAFMVFGG